MRFPSARRPVAGRLALVALLLLAALTGCQRASRQADLDQAPEIVAVLTTDPDPAQVGPATLVVQLSDASGAPVEGASVSLQGDMSHAGMQPVLAEVSGGAGGVYRAQWVWSMAGDWFVTVTAMLPDGRTLVRRFDLAVSRP
ncbi:MAG TPA: FixH family protein [Anaerolineae bacterium]|nr:FixH family protein [Anaerolineae bacterium]